MDPSAVIAAESLRFSEVLADTSPQTRCPTCPEWNADDLLWHLAEVQHFWAEVLARDARTDTDAEAIEADAPARPEDTQGKLDLRARGTELLLDQLDRLDDAEPRWSWWEPDQTVGFTRRMQTCEATIHRVDAELTAGVPVTPLTEDVAVAAIDHCADVMWGWMPEWGDYEPLATVELRATDIDRKWLIEVGHWTGTGPESGKSFDWPRAIRALGGDPSASVEGPAQDVALWFWTRPASVDISGEQSALRALDRLLAHGIQ